MRKLILTLILLFTLTACGEVEYSIILNTGDDIVYESETWIDKGCTITINDEDFSMTRDTDIDYTDFESQTITYSYAHKKTDYICKRIVLVVEEVDYNITIKASLDTIKLNTIYMDRGLVFHDDNEEDFTVIVTGDVNSTKRGTYTITYTIYGQDGRYLVLHRVVNVIS